jgi:hypothetical protein
MYRHDSDIRSIKRSTIHPHPHIGFHIHPEQLHFSSLQINDKSALSTDGTHEQHRAPRSFHAAPFVMFAAVLCSGSFPALLGSFYACSSALSSPLQGRKSLPPVVSIRLNGERSFVVRRLPCGSISRVEALLERM